MIVDDKLLNKLEHLSAIKLEENKKQEIKTQISEILDFVENLNDLDLPNEASSQNLHTPLREDIVEKNTYAESILNNAPNAKDGFFIVPKIVE